MSPDAPSLLLIVIDTLRRDHLSAYGYERLTSPAIDALAARGLGPDSVAGVFARSLKGFKASAADADALRALLDDLVTMTAANCDAPTSARTAASGG